MNVAEYIAERVRGMGTDTVFMLSGTGSIHLDDAFARADGIKHVCARHEAAAALMASGYNQISRNLGVVLVTSGPGGINAISGIAEAWVDSVPLLVISGQVERETVGHGRRAFGIQGFDVVSLAEPITKFARLIDDPSAIPDALDEAIHLATTGRQGPVWLDIPLDVQEASIDSAQALDVLELAPEMAAPSWGDLETALDGLSSSSRPVVLLGHGVLAADALQSFKDVTERIGAPIIASRLAHQALPFSHPLFLGLGGVRGRPPARIVLGEADFVLSLGCGLSEALVGKDLADISPEAQVAVVDIDLAAIEHCRDKIDFIVQSDVGEALDAMFDRLGGEGPIANSDWAGRCLELKVEMSTNDQSPTGDPINSYHFVAELERLSGPRHIFVSDAGGAYYTTGQTLDFERGQRELTSGTFATMGTAVPHGIGAAMGDPDAQVLIVTGDGSIELNVQELATLSHLDLDVKVIVLNNEGYASIRDSQDAMCGDGSQIDDRTNLDFERIASAFDLSYRRIAKCHQIQDVLSDELAHRHPVLIEVMCDPAQRMILPPPAPR